MVSFEESRERRSSRPSRPRSPRRDSRGGRSFGGSSRGRSQSFGGRRSFDRGPSRGGRDTRVVKTKVTCSKCGKECEVPFQPKTDKPLFCDHCYSSKEKENKFNSNGICERDLDIINEKLNKIMKALKVE